MIISLQERIIADLEEKITDLKMVLKETIEEHSDVAYDLRDLKLSLEELTSYKLDHSS